MLHLRIQEGTILSSDQKAWRHFVTSLQLSTSITAPTNIFPGRDSTPSISSATLIVVSDHHPMSAAISKAYGHDGIADQRIFGKHGRRP
jgi:hypothetical protein